VGYRDTSGHYKGPAWLQFAIPASWSSWDPRMIRESLSSEEVYPHSELLDTGRRVHSHSSPKGRRHRRRDKAKRHHRISRLFSFFAWNRQARTWCTAPLLRCAFSARRLLDTKPGAALRSAIALPRLRWFGPSDRQEIVHATIWSPVFRLL